MCKVKSYILLNKINKKNIQQLIQIIIVKVLRKDSDLSNAWKDYRNDYEP